MKTFPQNLCIFDDRSLPIELPLPWREKISKVLSKWQSRPESPLVSPCLVKDGPSSFCPSDSCCHCIFASLMIGGSGENFWGERTDDSVSQLHQAEDVKVKKTQKYKHTSIKNTNYKNTKVTARWQCQSSAPGRRWCVVPYHVLSVLQNIHQQKYTLAKLNFFHTASARRYTYT